MTYYLYILSNQKNGTLYVGSTNNLYRRLEEHRMSENGFANRYGPNRLVYVEQSDCWETIAQREKSIKRWRRSWKIALIEKENKNWDSLVDPGSLGYASSPGS